MRTRLTLIAALALSAALPLTHAHAGGFAVPEQGAAAVGMASAMQAKTDDPSAGYYNPANVAFQSGLNLYLGAQIILPDFTLEPAEGDTVTFGPSDKQFYIPNLFASYAIIDNPDWTFSAGLATFANYGASIFWPEDWAGATIVREIDLQTYTINPYVSYRRRINEDFTFAIGGGVDLVLGAVKLRRAIGFAEPDPSTPEDELGGITLGANDFAVGGNVGLTFEFANLLTLGLSYRSRYTFDFEGVADFQGVPATFAYDAQGNALFPDQTGSASLTLPDIISAQLALNLLDRALFLSLGIDLTLWSTYNELAINFSEPNPPSTAVPKGYNDSITFRSGFEYAAALSDGFTLKPRLGYAFDSSPVPDATLDPTLPDANRNIISAGLGFDLTDVGFYADLGYTLVLQSDRTSSEDDCFNFEGREVCNEFPATYSGSIHLLGITFGYRWGADGPDPEAAPSEPEPTDDAVEASE